MCVFGCSPLRRGIESFEKEIPGVIKLEIKPDEDLQNSLSKVNAPENYVFQGFFIQLNYVNNKDDAVKKTNEFVWKIKEFGKKQFWRGCLIAKPGLTNSIKIELVYSDERYLKSHMFDPHWPAAATSIPYLISEESNIFKDNDDKSIVVVESNDELEINRLISEHKNDGTALCIFCPEELLEKFDNTPQDNPRIITVWKRGRSTPL